MNFGIPTRNGLPLGLRSVMSFAFAPDLLVSPGAITSPLTLTRAQTGGAVATGESIAWETYGADTPRFVIPNGGLLIEGQRTNAVTNPRGEGASGTGAPPTTWTLSATRGLTHTFTPAVVNGVQGVVWAFSGTPNSTSGTELAFEAGLTSTAGQLCALSLFYQLVAGTNTLSSLTLRNANEAAGTATPFSPDATLRRVTNVTTAVGTVYRCRLSFGFPDTVTPVNTSIFLGWPQREQLAAFAATPILPPIGTPGASTRGADLVSASLSDLGVGSNGACTVLWTGRIPQNAPASADQAIFQIDTGATTDRHFVFNAAGGASIQLVCQVSGSTVGSGTAGTMTAGTLFRLGLSADGAGRVALCFNGATPVAVTGAASSALTRLLVGTGTGSDEMFGETTRFAVLPGSMPDAELQAAVAAFPSP
jgi:hypothetical protein